MSLGPITAKRAIKRAAGWAAVLTSPWVSRPDRPRACILMYHRVAALDFVDPRLDDWNVPPPVFAEHVAALAEFAECVPLAQLPARLRASGPGERPLVCITFDDGYANFVDAALPVLSRHRVPAACFVVTSCVASEEPMPFDRWAQRQRQPAAEPAAPYTKRGRDVFLASTCAMCHAVSGTTASARKAPDLTHLASRSTLAAGTLPNKPENLARWIEDPQRYKPGVNMPPHALPQQDAQALVAWLGTLQ